MAQPGMTSARGDDWLVRKVQELEQTVQRLSAANVFGLTGITPNDGGTDFDGYVNVNGPMTVNGNSEFKGNMKVSGTLNLPAGIIGNDALSSPLSPASFHTEADSFALATGANATKASITVSAPAGYTRAIVFATTSMVAQNMTASSDGFFLQCVINNTVVGWSAFTDVPASKVGSLATTRASLLTDIGASFKIEARASTNASNWASTTGNVLNIDAMVLFLR